MAMSHVAFIPCPFHDPSPGEYSNSLQINELGMNFYCYACRATGKARRVFPGELVPDGVARVARTKDGALFIIERVIPDQDGGES